MYVYMCSQCKHIDIYIGLLLNIYFSNFNKKNDGTNELIYKTESQM